MDKSIFIEEVRKIYPNRDINFDLFEKYKEYIQKENEFYNLSNIVSDEKIYFEYFFNSILPYSDFNFNNKELLDIGSGSGIPGIALKIIFPEMKLTIIESNLKKIKFMENLKDILLLDDVTFLNIRAEEISWNNRERFDYVTSRAVANLKVLSEISIPYLKIDGLLIEPKSTNYLNEIEEANWILKELKSEIIDIKKIKNLKEHNIIYIQKNKKTNIDYPRKWSIISAK